MKKPYLLLSLLLILIVSCSGVPKNREQGSGFSGQSAVTELVEVNSEQSAVTELGEVNNGQSAVIELVEVNQPEAITEETVLAETGDDIEKKPLTEYVENLSALDEPELQPAEQPVVIALETLRPVASPLEQASPAEQASLSESASPLETLPKPSPALQEQRTAQVVPPVRDSWRRPPVDEKQPVTSAEAESLANINSRGSPPEERILLPDYPITFSRTARVTVGQLVEIPFRGRDWVFLGEVGARRGIAYDSRKLDPEGESFVFRIEAGGVYALKFYRQDFAHDLILNDHVQIIAGGAPETTSLGWFNPPIDRSRVIAEPRWPNFLGQTYRIDSQPEQQLPVEEKVNAPVDKRELPAAETKQTDAKASQPPAAPPARRPSRPQGPSGSAIAQSSPAQTPSPQPAPPPAAEPKSPDAILKEAKDEFGAGRIASAITLLDQFSKSYPSGSDEAWWLYGQCYEANSPNRNILSALDFYRRLVREYPQSSRLSDARRRIAYLERYYINIQ